MVWVNRFARFVGSVGAFGREKTIGSGGSDRWGRVERFGRLGSVHSDQSLCPGQDREPMWSDQAVLE